MISKPLLTMVAELVVTTFPIAQVGCASASEMVTSLKSRRFLNGPPLAVKINLEISKNVVENFFYQSSSEGAKKNAFYYKSLIEKELNTITNRVNLFIEKEWQPFENKVKSQKFKVITEIKKY